MFFKLNSLYRQFSQISLRLITKKFISTAGNSLPLSSIKNSPLRNGKTTKNRIGMVSLRPTPFGIITIKRPEPKLKYSKRNYVTTTLESDSAEPVNFTAIPMEVVNEEKLKEKEYERSIDVMFPYLTGEELKAFDSSVYE